jgi:hypothetical protein
VGLRNTTDHSQQAKLNRPGQLDAADYSVFDSGLYRNLGAPQEKAAFQDLQMSACESETL